MKLTIERSVLLKTLSHMQTVVNRRDPIPILANVLLKAQGETLTLSATDMVISIVDAIPAEVEDPGEITVPMHTLNDIVRKLPQGTIKIAIGKDSRIKIRSGRSVFTLATLPADEFPPIEASDLPHSFSLTPGDFKNLIDRTRFAISTEETRYYMCGIYLYANGGVMRAVATDGHRLARFEMPTPDGAGNMPGIILPSKTVGELSKLVDETDQPVDVALSDTKIRFSFDSTVLYSKLVDGKFPDYQRVIPNGNDKILKANVRDFADAVDRVAIIANEKSHAINLVLDGDTLTLHSKTNTGNEAVEKIEVSYDRPAMDVGFNFKYLLDIFQNIEGESVEFAFADEKTAALVTDADDTDAKSLYLLMPMRY